jgi:hypothetical protein
MDNPVKINNASSEITGFKNVSQPRNSNLGKSKPA